MVEATRMKGKTWSTKKAGKKEDQFDFDAAYEEDEDYHHVRLAYRLVRPLRGEPGIEQFTIDKTGSIELHQVVQRARREERLAAVAPGGRRRCRRRSGGCAIRLRGVFGRRRAD